jgi:hypothetical protein
VEVGRREVVIMARFVIAGKADSIEFAWVRCACESVNAHRSLASLNE